MYMYVLIHIQLTEAKEAENEAIRNASNKCGQVCVHLYVFGCVCLYGCVYACVYLRMCMLAFVSMRVCVMLLIRMAGVCFRVSSCVYVCLCVGV